jgi:hypothetical protein
VLWPAKKDAKSLPDAPKGKRWQAYDEEDNGYAGGDAPLNSSAGVADTRPGRALPRASGAFPAVVFGHQARKEIVRPRNLRGSWDGHGGIRVLL